MFVATSAFLAYHVLHRTILCTLAKIPGPRIFALTSWRLAIEDFKGSRTRKIQEIHVKYGPVVRIGPREVSFNSLSALRKIYGAGSGFERTDFYRMFDVYGKENMFTFGPVQQHAERKKMLSHAYSKSSMIKGEQAAMIQDKARQYMQLLESEPGSTSEMFSTLHFFSLDAITDFVYGKYGSTQAVSGSQGDRALLNDILDPARRKLSWFAVHFPAFTKWLYTRVNLMERLVKPLLPMKKPLTYTGIRTHALQAWQQFYREAKQNWSKCTSNHVMGLLWSHHKNQGGSLDDLDIASECADHLLAGIDTTSDTLMFLTWALSLTRNRRFQDKLAEEVSSISEEACDDFGVPTPEACASLPYLDAIIKETLRVYAPLPASEPRVLRQDINIDGYMIPADTVVSMEPYSLHRNAEIFEEPLEFNPDRWLGDGKKVAEMKKWWWAFSSGGRMCIGMHLAMAEMTTLVSAIYRKYITNVRPGSENKTPAITSRFEMFYDESFEEIEDSSFKEIRSRDVSDYKYSV
ncbi:cytochrome P450 [Rhizodiscina lignyota]|uniref:Cytochrome P450 n=1 Tax=Rhizodiscina lignyota TaxID=1504668 RepID=A0A9P4M2U2_9PEZI|nr:cytochrome P450 [Rhizodiscina lignyota]